MWKKIHTTYYEKIEQDKQKHLCYEIIWQIGDMRDMGFVYTTEDSNRRLKPQMKRDRYGGADWVETQKAVLQDMVLKEFGWERFYKGSNPRGNLTLSDYRREKAAEMEKEEERKLKEKLNKAYDFMRQVTINGVSMLEHFRRSSGEWVQQKVALMSR